MKISLFLNVALILSVFLLVAFISPDMTQDSWQVPEKYEEMKNPMDASDKSAMKIGRTLYNKHCKSCHGSEGYGDGSKAAQLETPCGDFTTEEFQSQSDGALFYKTKFGREEMPGFEKKIPDDDDLWAIVNYIREF